jgi:hypothetical protein
MLHSSFAAFKKRRSGDFDWIKERTDAAMRLRHAMPGPEKIISWEDELAAMTGVLSGIDIRSIADRLVESVGEPLGPVNVWVEWGLSWLEENPLALADVLRPMTVQSVFGKRYKAFGEDKATAITLLRHIQRVLPLWIGGSPLNKLELQLNDDAPTKCDSARDWALRLAPDLAYLFSIVIQTFKRMPKTQSGSTPKLTLAFTLHARCVREGFDQVEKLALHQVMGGVVPRVAVHQRFAQIADALEGGGDYEKWAALVRRVAKANKQVR